MKKLIAEVRDLLGIELTQAQIEAFEIYRRELITWNGKANLTAIIDPDQIRVKHFLDSASCLIAMRGSPMASVVDVGTGAGFPGIPLKILCPSMHLVLVESIGKKADFLRHLIGALNLEGTEVFQDRAENRSRQPEHRERYDWAVARAVARMPVLMEYLLPFVHIGGQALAMKGETGPAEAHAAERALELLGGQLNQIIPVDLPEVPEERFLLVCDKVAATPQYYPRRVGIPSKRPL